MNDASDARVQMILQRSLTASQVGARLGLPQGSAGDAVNARRTAYQLFGVWDKTRCEFVYPDFQFEPGVADATLHSLLKLLSSCYGYDPAIEDTGGWRRAFWLYQRNRLLSARVCAYSRSPIADPEEASQYLRAFSNAARTPAEAFAQDPENVLALVRKMAGYSMNAEADERRITVAQNFRSVVKRGTTCLAVLRDRHRRLGSLN